MTKLSKLISSTFFMIIFFTILIYAQESNLDLKVKEFLEKNESDWHDMNIPERDGKFMYDIIIENDYKSALEIGTSTGHSAIWIAWALSKTGGKLITIEIDEDRYNQAVEYFEEAGLSEYIDARLADAHQLVKELNGPFDFVFSDADKDWYTQYFIDIAPKMKVGGRYLTHNISMRRRNISEYVEFLNNQPNFETIIENSISSGISVSYKKSDK